MRQRPADVHLFAEEPFTADGLKRAAQVGGIDERTEAWMDGADVIVFQVNFEEDFPVEVVLLFIDMVLLFFISMTSVFLLRVFFADRRRGRGRTIGAAGPTRVISTEEPAATGADEPTNEGEAE